MTAAERDDHNLIDGKRRKRIARGSGTSVQEVNQVLKQYLRHAPDDEAVRQPRQKQDARHRQIRRNEAPRLKRNLAQKVENRAAGCAANSRKSG